MQAKSFTRDTAIALFDEFRRAGHPAAESCVLPNEQDNTARALAQVLAILPELQSLCGQLRPMYGSAVASPFIEAVFAFARAVAARDAGAIPILIYRPYHDSAAWMEMRDALAAVLSEAPVCPLLVDRFAGEPGARVRVRMDAAAWGPVLLLTEVQYKPLRKLADIFPAVCEADAIGGLTGTRNLGHAVHRHPYLAPWVRRPAGRGGGRGARFGLIAWIPRAEATAGPPQPDEPLPVFLATKRDQTGT
jgi:hypothetical protein